MKYTILIALLASISAKAGHFRQCDELPLNTPMDVNLGKHESPTEVSQKYRLLRNSAKVYTAFIKYRFVPRKDYDLPYKNRRELNLKFQEKLNECFKTPEAKLVDEKGRTLRLRAFMDTMSDVVAPSATNTVHLKKTDARADSTNFNSNVDCPTLVHESLHLLGLVDEYREEWLGKKHGLFSNFFGQYKAVQPGVLPSWDCRAIGPKESIMYDHKTPALHKIFSGQLDVIIYPNCASRNEKYYTCSSFAYKTSSKNSGMPKFLDCAKQVPDYCRNVDWVKN